jgi:hypothetical protein
MCGDGKARQKNLPRLATVVMCGDGKVKEHALLRDSLVLCALLLLAFLCSLRFTHTHTHGMVMHWSNGGGSFGSTGRNYNDAARLLLTQAPPPLAAMVKGLLHSAVAKEKETKGR